MSISLVQGSCACGGPASVTHACPSLGTHCRLCGSPDGGSTSHSCPTLRDYWGNTIPVPRLEDVLLSRGVYKDGALVGWASL